MVKRSELRNAQEPLSIPQEVLARIEKEICAMIFGTVTLVLQDAHIIQMNKLEKIRFDSDEALKGARPATPETNSGTAQGQGLSSLRRRIIEAIGGLRHGEVVIVIQKGRIVQIERTEKRRFPLLEGLYGDGI
ncbi:hypothetical protein HM1_1735 [Heliomicrobium modesticaldum Ice1]|uniref:DUF2292 domain-containing protein n=1 Tax=Heliobacterium modesticaldum (strain ATCC 51547 / Ice1) TaxID=498761 RepID=B0TEQ3_HELMI|nr:YezD family protein [Heliomicrobium modesticaldum]ABZ84305.1 hypothetical protein HM1_1735 [Heliomicrobium modesticaldum Ice1]